jgi:hypothetical protein
MSAGTFRFPITRRDVAQSSGVAAVCVVLVLMSAANVSAQCNANQFCVNYDTSSSMDTTLYDSNSDPDTYVAWSHTMADGIHRAIVVSVSIRKPSGSSLPTVSSVTYDSISLIPITAQNSADDPSGKRIEMWGLAGDSNVTVGANDVEVTLTGSAEFVTGAVTFTGVDPNSAFGSTNERADDANDLVQLGIENAPTSSVCVGVVAVEGDVDATVHTGLPDQTNEWNQNTGSASSNATGAGSTQPGAGAGLFVTTYFAWNLDADSYWVAGLTRVNPYQDTAVRLAWFGAEVHGRSGAALHWRTGGELGALGFKLFREDHDGELVQVNRGLIAGSALMSSATLKAGYSYGWLDPAGSAGDRYWLVEVEIDGAERRYGPFRAVATDESVHEVAQSLTLGEVARPRGSADARVIPSSSMATKSVAGDLQRQLELAADPTAVKIGVNDRGWYRITRAELLGAGLPEVSDAAELQLYTSGIQVPIEVVQVGDGHSGLFEAIEFYGVGVDEASTDTRVYWLVEGDEPGLRISQDASGSIGHELATLPYSLELRERLVYVASFANGDESNFYGAVLTGDPVDQVLAVTGLDTGATEPGQLELKLRGFSEGAHTVRVELNGVYLADLTGEDQGEMNGVVAVAPGMLVEGENVVRLSSGAAGDISLVDTITLTYPRLSVAGGDELLVSVPDEVESFVIAGFSRPWVRVLEVNDPFNVSDLGLGASRDGGQRAGGPKSAVVDGHKVAFRLPQGIGRTVHAIGPDRVMQPAWLALNEASSWSEPDDGGDVLMIAARELIPALQPLVAFREAQGHTVQVVAVDDAYDERSFGVKRADAIRDLVGEAVAGWSTPPAVLILVGDASYDPRDYLGFGNVDLVPAKFVSDGAFEAASDDWFADVDGDSFADLIVGRLPVKTPAQLEALVAKTIAYESGAAAWAGALYVSDEDMGGQFEGSSYRLMGALPSLAAGEVKVRELGSSAARSAVLDALNAGVDLVSYVGHGAVERWSGDVLSVDLLDQIAVDAPPAVFTMMNCMNGYFFDAALDSLSEGLLSIGGGAIAVFAPTGITGWAPQEPMMTELYEVFEANPQGMTLGQAVAVAKQAAGSDAVRRTWVVLGDPMIHVR